MCLKRNNQLSPINKVSNVTVRKRMDESTEDLIKRFRKKFSKSGLTREVKEKMYFEKPSDKRRRKRAQAIRALRKEEEKVVAREEQRQKYLAKKKRKERKHNERTKRTSNRKSRNREATYATEG